MYSGSVSRDPDSSLTPPGYVTSHSQLSASLTSMGTPPSDGAVQLNHMYLEAKMNMLKIIEQGLQLKLDIQDIKDKFLRLINDFEEYEQLSRCPGMLPPYLPEMPTRQHAKMSAAQRRVWAFYELRRARIQAKRSASRRRDAETKRLKVKEMTEQKENTLREHASSRYRGKMLEHSTSTPVSTPDKPLSAITWSIQNFLTPIREEYGDRHSNNVCLNDNFHALGANMSPQTRHHTSLCTCDNIAVPHSTIKPDSSRVDHQPLHRHRSFTGSEDLSANIKPNWKISASSSRRRSQSTNDLLHYNQVCRPSEKYSQRAVQTALSETIRDIYTNNSLKDISVINKSTEGVIDKSSSGTSQELNNTFKHPLHSTLEYPLHSTLTTEGTTLNVEYPPTDSSSHSIYSQDCKHYHVDLSPLKQTTDNKCFSFHSYSSDSSPNISRTPQNSFSPSSYRTPSKKPQAQLCKEHGIHPTFGGSCIFKNGVTMMLNISDEELDHDENGNTAKDSSNVRETDCDSSYLSEGLDDHQSSIDIDHYVATYDSRKACIRLLKRQTGQVKLSDIKQPVGLSESDLYCDIINKHFSLEAMRSSLPDLSGLSTLPTSAAEDESSDMTLQASSTLKSHTGNMPQESSDVLSPDDALVGNEQRLVSLSANEDSPESNTAMPVPVNSPNITDSGGSSGKQNTDNYDYTEMQPERLAANPDRISLPGSYTTHSSQSCQSRKSQSLQSQHSHRSSKSYQPHRQSSPVQHHRHRRRYASTPAQLSDARSSRTTKSRSSRQSRSNKVRHAMFPHPSVMCCQSGHHQSYDLDPGCSGQGTRPVSAPFTIRDNMGRQRTIVQHTPVSQHLPKERKKALVKKLKHFSNSFYRGTSTGNLQIETLGHF